MVGIHGIGVDLLAPATGWELLEAQYDRWRRAYAAHQQWAKVAKMCVEFYEGQQWTDRERAILDEENRPCITLNKIAPLIRILLGYYRQNKFDIDFLPGNDGTGTQEIADTLVAIQKQIAEVNHTEWLDAMVFQDGIFTGRGFIDQRLSFDSNALGEVKETVKDPFNMLVDPEADTYAPRDWGYIMESRWMSPVEIFTNWGVQGARLINETGSSLPIVQGSLYEYFNEVSPDRYFGLTEDLGWDYEVSNGLQYSRWDHINRHRKLVRVLDCQHKQLRRVQYFVDLSTGQEKIINQSWPREKIYRVLQWAEMRGIPISIREGVKKVVRWTTTAGDKVLWDDWSPYSDYTVTGYFPYFRRGKTMSPIEDMIDPQREINRRSSAILHIIMTSANSGWIYEQGSLEQEMERALEEEGSRPGINIKYREGYNKPEKIMPSLPPTAAKMYVDDKTNDLKEIAGINDSALGQIDKVQSGRAIQARQQQSIIGAEMYYDNFSYYQQLKGERGLSLIQNFYTEPRIIRVRGDKGQDQTHQINVRDAAGQIINNVSEGKYNVVVDQAPMSASFMQAQFEEAMELVAAGIPIPPDVLVDLSSMPKKEIIKERLNQERLAAETAARLEMVGASAGMGVPPGQPIPPVVSDGGPPVTVAQMPPTPIPVGQPALSPEAALQPTRPPQLGA